LSETLRNPREYLQEACLINPTLGENHTITHKEEFKIMFLPDYLMNNLIQASQIPPRVLKDNRFILPKGLMFILPMGLMCILLRDKLFNPLKGKLFIPRNHINRFTPLRIH
jgi:hypothetical protein